MAGFRGVVAGALTLIAAETILSTEAAATRTAGAFGTIAGLVDRMLDPTVPAIPDLNVAGSRSAGPGKPTGGGLKLGPVTVSTRKAERTGGDVLNVARTLF